MECLRCTSGGVVHVGEVSLGSMDEASLSSLVVTPGDREPTLGGGVGDSSLKLDRFDASLRLLEEKPPFGIVFSFDWFRSSGCCKSCCCCCCCC